MKTIRLKPIRYRLLAATITLVISFAALAQNPKPNNISLHLGDAVVVIPTPDGFEEAASQFESVKAGFTATEAEGNDILAVHLLTADCDKLRRGGAGPFNFYTKISVLKTARERDYSAADFAAIPGEFRKSGAVLLDINGPQMKAAVERVEKVISESGANTKVALGQPENLGEFDNRPNRYSIMLLMNLAMQTGNERRIVPLLASVTFLRVKQRLLYVYAYRKYDSKADVEILQDFTKHWIDNILAAN